MVNLTFQNVVNVISQNPSLIIANIVGPFILAAITVRWTLIRYFGWPIKLTNVFDVLIVNLSRTVYVLWLLIVLGELAMLYSSFSTNGLGIGWYETLLPTILGGVFFLLMWKISREFLRKGVMSQDAYRDTMRYWKLTLAAFVFVLILANL